MRGTLRREEIGSDRAASGLEKNWWLSVFTSAAGRDSQTDCRILFKYFFTQGFFTPSRSRKTRRRRVHHQFTLDAVAQKADVRFHPENAAAIIRRAKDVETGTVIAATSAGIVVEANGKLRKIRDADLDRLTICRAGELTVGKGDRLQIKANAPGADGRKLANGEIVSVAKNQTERHHRAQRRTHHPGDLPAIYPRLRSHVIRLAGQNRRTRPLFRLRYLSCHKRRAIVRHYLARAEKHLYFHPRQSRTRCECRAHWKPPTRSGRVPASQAEEQT